MKNETLNKYAREQIKKGLAQCTDAQCRLFKQMYAHGKFEMPINDVVDNMPEEKLDWAMQQVKRSTKIKGGVT